jgi:hypothetical protein
MGGCGEAVTQQQMAKVLFSEGTISPRVVLGYLERLFLHLYLQ